MEISGYFDIILLIGSTLSLVMAVFLWLHPAKLFANYILGTLNFLWFFVSFVFVMQSPEFYMKFPHIDRIASFIPLVFFPLLYIYSNAYLTGYNWRHKSFFLHFIPSLLYFLAVSPYFFQSAEAKRLIIETNNYPAYFAVLNRIFDPIIILQGIFYTTLSMQLILRFQKKIKHEYPKYYLDVTNWLKFFVISNVVLWAIGSVGAIFGLLKIDVPINLFDIFYLGLTILTIGIGVFSLKHPFILNVRFKHDGKIINNKELAPKDENEEDNDNRKNMRLIIDYLEKEKAYLKNNLSLDDITKATGVPKHRISAIFNNELGKNFYEILNEYRTREAIRLMKEGKHMNFTLTYIAEMAGFNSRATFNRIFKKLTNQTPSEFIRSTYLKND